jgi:hypothetical protein
MSKQQIAIKIKHRQIHSDFHDKNDVKALVLLWITESELVLYAYRSQKLRNNDSITTWWRTKLSGIIYHKGPMTFQSNYALQAWPGCQNSARCLKTKLQRSEITTALIFLLHWFFNIPRVTPARIFSTHTHTLAKSWKTVSYHECKVWLDYLMVGWRHHSAIPS